VALANLKATDPGRHTAAGKDHRRHYRLGSAALDNSVHTDLGAVEPLVDCQPQRLAAFRVVPRGIDNDGHGTLLPEPIAAVPGNAIGVARPFPPPGTSA